MWFQKPRAVKWMSPAKAELRTGLAWTDQGQALFGCAVLAPWWCLQEPKLWNGAGAKVLLSVAVLRMMNSFF